MFNDSEKLKIEQKLKGHKCPMCGSEDKFLTEVPTQIISYHKNGDEYDFSKLSYINCLCVECLNCGYLSQYRLNTLLK